MVLLVFNNATTYLLVALSLGSCIKAYDGIFEEDVRTFTSENTRRPEVRIPHGTVRGINMVTHHGRNIFGFKAIPFARPPVGSLRFKGPVPVGPWNGTLDASNDPKPCPQVQDNAVIGDEDCLYLNIYIPRLPVSENSTLLPVMVYFFGGGFTKGSITSTEWGPYYILDKDVVLVVPSYRLGVLGWLSTGDEVAPGNWGLKDQVHALKWNQDNIQYFGGDPSQVTLVGGSSGGMNVGLLTLSNLTNGLFHRYITQSGPVFSPECYRPRKALANRAVQLGKYFGCSTNTSITLVKCLRSIDANMLVNKKAVFYIWRDMPTNIWGPTIEANIEGAILIDTPVNLYKAGKIRDIPQLSSLTKIEGIIQRSSKYRPDKDVAMKVCKDADVFQDFLDNIDLILPHNLLYYSLVDNVTAYTAALKSYYLNDLTADKTLLINNLTQLESDAIFNYHLYTEAQQRLRYAKSPEYICSFEYDGTFSHSYRHARSTDWGAVHGDEALYLFQQPRGEFGPPESEMNEADWKMVDLMVQLWTSFVINGRPTTSDQNCTTIWEPYSSRKNYLQIGSNSNVTLEVKYDLFKDHAQFWKELTANTSWK